MWDMTNWDVIKFLKLYERHECLWNPKLVEYRNVQKRYAALQNIIAEMKLKVTKNELKLKIKNLRTSYHREVTKINNSKKSGAGTDIYKPTLSWFNEADRFLKLVVEGRTSMNDMDNKSVKAELAVSLEESRPNTVNDAPSPVCEQEKSPRKVFRSPPKRPQKKLRTSSMSSIENAIIKLDSIAEARKEDEFDIFAKHIASQLRQLPLRRALLCQNKIQCFVTEERINCLSSNPQPSPSLVPRSSALDSSSSLDA